MSQLKEVQRIEGEIRQIQYQMSPNEARTSLFNLVVFLPREKEREAEGVLSILHGQRPSRIILIHLDYEGETRIEVNAKCVEDHQNRGICLQEIHVFSGQDHFGEDHGTWSSLLIREIPVYLVWLGQVQPYPHLLLESEDPVDRVILDSRSTADPLSFFQDLKNKGHWSNVAYGDIAWGRISPLLRATALLFNPFECRDLLHQITEIQFRGGEQAEALLFFLWFGVKMGFSFHQLDKRGKFLFQKEGHTLGTQHLKEDVLEKGFEILFFTPTKNTFRIVSNEEGYVLQESPGNEGYKSILKVPKLPEILLKEVDKTGQDRLFLETIQRF